LRADCNYAIGIESEVGENSGRLGEMKCNPPPPMEMKKVGFFFDVANASNITERLS